MACQLENGVFTYTEVIPASIFPAVEIFEIPIQEYSMIRFNGFIGDSVSVDLQILDPTSGLSVTIQPMYGLAQAGVPTSEVAPWFDFAPYGAPSVQNKGACITLTNSSAAPVFFSYSQKKA